MKKQYIAPQMMAYTVQGSEILAESETITVYDDDPDKSVPTMMSKDILFFEFLIDE